MGMAMKKLQKSKIVLASLFIAGIAISLYIRIVFFPYYSGDSHDSLIPWYDFMVEHGFFRSLSQNFYNYNPPYIYLIGLTTFFTWIPKLTAIKIISVIFDFVAAAAAYHIVFFKRQDQQWAWLAFFTVLFAPTVFIESGFWGQCDVIYTAFLLWMIYFLLREHYFKALIFFSLAFVFKSQAIFLAPLILFLFIKRKLPFYSLLIPITIYLLSILPAWLAGRSFMDLLGIYFSQVGTYNSLSMNAPNLFFLFSGKAYYSVTGVFAGLIIAALFVVGYLIIRVNKTASTNVDFYFYDACFLAFFIPFLLPKMHDRYFFPAALFFLIIAFFDKKALWLGVSLQISTLLSFLGFLYNLPFNSTAISFVINIVLMVFIFRWYLKKIRSQAPQTISTNTLAKNS
jgi:Gpi18-like mannosyltransferase